MDKVDQLKLVTKVRAAVKTDVSISADRTGGYIKVETFVNGVSLGQMKLAFDHWQDILDGKDGLNGLNSLVPPMRDPVLDYCSECLVPDHDACSLVDGCPCCDNTKSIQNSQT